MEATPPRQPCKLFVGGLSAQTSTETLREHFSRYGRLVDAVVMSKQGRPRGFGFVRFETPGCAALALAEPQWLDGRFVDVKGAVPGEQPEERTPNKIFVGGLPQDASTEDLKTCFLQYGRIADALVMVDRRTKRSRGFGFIRFASGAQGARATEAVMAANNHRVGGKWIEVKRATPAALLQECSPDGSCDAGSPFRTPGSQQRRPALPVQLQELQEQLQHSMADAAFATPAGLRSGGGLHSRSATPTAVAATLMEGYAGMCGLERRLFDHSVWEQSAFAASYGVDSFGMEGGAGFGCSYPPHMRPRAGELSVFDPILWGGGHVDFQVHQDPSGEAILEAPPMLDQHSSASSTAKCSQENRSPAANRAVTPPPGSRQAKQPLNFMVSPIKVECRSKDFEDLVAGSEGLLGFARCDGLMKVQPLQVAR